MYGKLLVFKPKNVITKSVRRKSKSALTQLEKFERLKSLCCLSEMERKRMEAAIILGPRKKDLEEADEPCDSQRPVELMDIRHKTAMVVGGASGVGYEISRALVNAGAMKVCIVDYRQDRSLAAVEKINACLPQPVASPIMADIRSDCAFDMAFREAIRCFCQVDIFVNCVGMFDETPECWDQMMNLNLIGTIRGTILAYHYLSQNTRECMPQGGVILNVSSYAAIANIPSMPLYSAASNGILGLTSSFGQDFHFCNTGVRFVAVCPSCTTSDAFKKMEKFHYRPDWAPHSQVAMKCKQKQTAKDVANAIIHTIKFGLNGNVYAVMNGKLYRYKMPDYRRIVRYEASMM